jgi:iron(III) transport system substrate-binding protein
VVACQPAPSSTAQPTSPPAAATSRPAAPATPAAQAAAPTSAAAPASAPATSAPTTVAAAAAGPTSTSGTSGTTGTRSWDQVVAAAKQEGVVSVYGPPGTSYRTALVEAFATFQPSIKVDYSGADGAQQATKLVAERQGGKFLADVYIGGSGSVLRSLVPAKVLDPLEPAFLLPEVRDKSLWFQNDYMFLDSAEKYFMAFMGDAGGVTVAYNTQQLKADDLNAWTDLLDPKWRGKIVSGDPQTNGVSRGNLTSVASIHGIDYLRKLFAREHGVALTGDNRQLTDWIVQGRYPIGIGVVDMTDARSVGLPIEERALDDVRTIGGGFGNLGLVNQAPHPNAALVYINWLLGKNGQIEYQKALEIASLRLDVTREGVPPDRVPDPKVKYVNTQREDFLPLRDEVQKVITELAAGR